MTAKSTTTIRIGGDYAARLAELLEFCDEFFAHASPSVHVAAQSQPGKDPA